MSYHPKGLAASKTGKVYKMTPEAEEAFLRATKRRLNARHQPARLNLHKIAEDAVKRGSDR